MSTTEKFNTIMPSEVRNFEWELKNFIALSDIDEALEDSKLIFSAGEKLGIPSEWSFSIEEDEDKLRIDLTLKTAPEVPEKIFAEFTLLIKRQDGTVFFEDEIDVTDMKEDKDDVTGFEIGVSETIVSKESNVLVNGSLVLHLRFELYGHNSVITRKSSNEVMELRALSRSAVANDMLKVLNNGLHPDVVIKMKDSQTFNVHRTILAARSPVFLAMFESKMLESRTKSVKIYDMSSAAMRVLLRHIYSGSLEDDWIPVAEEVVNAAEKYNLPLLKKFCDQMLVSACTTETALNFLKLAKLHDLKTAIKDITEYIKLNMGSVLEVLTQL